MKKSEDDKHKGEEMRQEAMEVLSSKFADFLSLLSQGGYNGHCDGGDFRRQMAGILTISHLHHSPTPTS